MPRFFPFEGLVFDPAVVGSLDRVTAPPYDVISDARRRELLARSPFSVVRLDLASEAEEGGSRGRYANSAALLREWLASGALRSVPRLAFFVYVMRFALAGRQRAIRGVFCAMELEPWGGSVIPHERTLPGPIDDRLQLLRATRTHLSAVYGTVAGPCPELAELLERATADRPPYSCLDDEGVEHSMWPLPADTPVDDWLADQPLMIADGHHRYTTALHYRSERHAQGGPGPWDRILTLVVDATTERPPVLPFHRVQLEGSPPAIGERVADLDAAVNACSDDDLIVATVTRGGDGLEFRAAHLSGEPPAVRALHVQLLDAVAPFGSLRFLTSAREAADLVSRGEAVAAYLLPPTTTDRIRRIVDRGERLPEKSTYFWPKPRTGMVMMPVV